MAKRRSGEQGGGVREGAERFVRQWVLNTIIDKEVNHCDRAFPLRMLQKRHATSPESGGAITVERIFSAASLGSPSVRLREKPGMSSLFTTEMFSMPSPPDRTFREEEENNQRRAAKDRGGRQQNKQRARDWTSLRDDFTTDAPAGTKTGRESERECHAQGRKSHFRVLATRPGDRRSTAKPKDCSCPL